MTQNVLRDSFLNTSVDHSVRSRLRAHKEGDRHAHTCTHRDTTHKCIGILLSPYMCVRDKPSAPEETVALCFFVNINGAYGEPGLYTDKCPIDFFVEKPSDLNGFESRS